MRKTCPACRRRRCMAAPCRGGLCGPAWPTPGVPKDIWSLTGTYDFGNGLALTASAVDVDAAPAGFSKSVMLPAYTLVNMGVVFERGNWTFSATAKNLTDERYFRANFPNLFGGVIVLPELPRHYSGRIEVRW